MRRIVTDERVVLFVGEETGTKPHEACTSLGLEDDGEVVVGVVFNNWTTHDIEVTVAGAPNAGIRQFLRRVGDYVFHELGCLRMTITTHQQSVVELAKRLGAVEEGKKRDHFGAGRDGIILGILREDWIIR